MFRYVASKRIVVAGNQLAVVIRGWLRAIPGRLWPTDPNYEQLKALKRHDPTLAPDPRHELAEYLVARLDELGWEMTSPEPEPQVSPPARPVTFSKGEPQVWPPACCGAAVGGSEPAER